MLRCHSQTWKKSHRHGSGQRRRLIQASRRSRSLVALFSIASWSLRFGLEKADVIVVLSGMSTLDQMRDNVRTAKEAKALSEEEKKALEEAMRIYCESAPIP